jgi:hypothetical protein
LFYNLAKMKKITVFSAKNSDRCNSTIQPLDR